MTKERLRNYTAIRREAERLEDRLAQLREEMHGPKAVNMSGAPGGGSHEGSGLEAAVVRYLDLERLYQQALERLVAEQIAIETAIETLDSVERQLMRSRYIDGLKWEEVCVVIGYSWQQTHRLHARALERLASLE